MSTIPDLNELENKAFRSSNQDGLWDIYLGMVLSWLYLSDLLFGRAKESWIRILGLCAGFALIYTLFWMAKKWISTPRLGQAKFGNARKAKLRRMAIILITAVAINLVLVILTRWLHISKEQAFLKVSDLWLALGVSAWVSVIIVIIGYFKGFNRLMYYSALFGGSFIGAILLDAPVSFFLAGLPMIVIGVILFIRFLREYSIPEVDIDE
jgi:magnesium-transporting ATPase (P-type)